MPNSKLKALVKLIDDDTEEVQKEVIKELKNYGYNLEQDLLEFSDMLSQNRAELLRPILEINRKNWFRSNWIDLQSINDDYIKLEFAMSYIAKFQFGLSLPTNLTLLLNEIANEFNNYYPFGNEIDLALFLFQQKGILGAKEDYYNPFNSNLIYTIEQGKGIPITLAILYMLVGYRLGFDIKGCNFPGHFLAKFMMDEEIVLVDGFNGGKLIYEHEIVDMVGSSFHSVFDLVEQDTSAKQILKRVLTNLKNAYSKGDDEDTVDFITKLSHLDI